MSALTDGIGTTHGPVSLRPAATKTANNIDNEVGRPRFDRNQSDHCIWNSDDLDKIFIHGECPIALSGPRPPPAASPCTGTARTDTLPTATERRMPKFCERASSVRHKACNEAALRKVQRAAAYYSVFIFETGRTRLPFPSGSRLPAIPGTRLRSAPLVAVGPSLLQQAASKPSCAQFRPL